jgi:hypothetical protein
MARQDPIDIQVSLDRKRKAALRTGLQAILAAEEGWRVVIRTALIYETTSSGSWWWSVALRSNAGAQHLLLVPPGQQMPELVADLVGKAIRGDLPTIVCSGCKRVGLKDGRWHVRTRPKNSHVTHGVCPECMRRRYSSLSRRSG